MKTINFSWQAIAWQSEEKGTLQETFQGWEVKSAINGLYESKSFVLRYDITLNRSWETQAFHINFFMGDYHQDSHFIRSSRQWLRDGELYPHLTGCIDIDITATPFTNTLPIRRMEYLAGIPRETEVVFVDIFEGGVIAQRQQYTRTDDHHYHFNQPANSFCADLTVDDDGLVIDYPKLFRRGEAGI
jgi:hypothetical protein